MNASTYVVGRYKERTLIPETEVVGGVTQAKEDTDGNVIYQKDSAGKYLYQESWRWTFRAETLVLRTEVEGHVNDLESQVLRDQYEAVTGDHVKPSMSFSRSVSGTDVAYTWEDKTLGRTYTPVSYTHLTLPTNREV